MTSTEILTAEAQGLPTESADSSDYITMTIADQLFGLPVLSVQDVLGPQKIACVPLAPDEVAGSLNLRGRIVTAVDMRTRLGLPPCDESVTSMSVVVDYQGELYSLIIDAVGEVLSLPKDRYERSPPTLDPRWREVANGIFRLDDRLLVVLDISQILNFGGTSSA